MIKIGHIESFAYSTAKEAVVGRARERAPECRLPVLKRTLHGYVAYYRL